MAKGRVKKLTNKGFGFIDTGTGDLFFHASSLQDGLRFDDLQEGDSVEYQVGDGPKGARAEEVRRID
jgi:CspA family cold shock protein